MKQHRPTKFPIDALNLHSKSTTHVVGLEFKLIFLNEIIATRISCQFLFLKLSYSKSMFRIYNVINRTVFILIKEPSKKCH